MVQADIVSVFRTLLTIVAVYYGIRFLFRVAFPWILKWWLQRVAQRMQSQYSNQQPSDKSRSESDRVSITTDDRNSSSSSGQSGGEYIDFEEV